MWVEIIRYATGRGTEYPILDRDLYDPIPKMDTEEIAEIKTQAEPMAVFWAPAKQHFARVRFNRRTRPRSWCRNYKELQNG